MNTQKLNLHHMVVICYYKKNFQGLLFVLSRYLLTHEAFIDVQKESKSVRLMPPFSNGFINVLRLILSGLLSQIKLNISHLVAFKMSSGNFGKTDRKRVSLGIANVLITVELLTFYFLEGH